MKTKSTLWLALAMLAAVQPLPASAEEGVWDWSGPWYTWLGSPELWWISLIVLTFVGVFLMRPLDERTGRAPRHVRYRRRKVIDFGHGRAHVG